MSIFQKIENEDEWRDLLSKALFKTFFHAPEWENFLEKEFFWIKFEHYLWQDELLMSIARCRLLGKEKIISHPFCEYGGPLPLREGIDWEKFLRDFREFFSNKAKIKFHPHMLGAREDNRLPQISTFWIEDFSKKTPEDLWSNFRKTLKQEIKKDEGIFEIRECQNESELRQFYNIYLRTVKRHKNIPLPFQVIEFIASARRRHEEEASTLFVAKRKDKVVGGSAFLFYPPFIHYFISASDERRRGENIGHQILWHVMQKYVGRRTSHIYDYFDLGGTRKGSALEVFKRGWGAKEYPIYQIGIAQVGSRSSLLRGLLGLVPTVISRRLAPLALWTKI